MLSPVRPSIAAFLLTACISLPLGQFGPEAAGRPPRKISKIEVKLSGPSSVGAEDSLESQRFTALLTNRSVEPQVLFVRAGILMNAHWDWTVTDTKGQPVGMDLVPRWECGTVPYSEEAEREWPNIRDKDLIVLAPGESREFLIPGGPSDDYSFPKAGIYHLAVTLTYVPPNAMYYFDEQGKQQKAEGFPEWNLSHLSVDSLEAVQNSLSIKATSDTWNLNLTAPRVHPDASDHLDIDPNLILVPAP
jgi:hypothetical protein